jgi:hypothetical protein
LVVPRDVPQLREEDRGDGGPHAGQAQEQPIRWERRGDVDELGFDLRDARPQADQAGREVGEFEG